MIRPTPEEIQNSPPQARKKRPGRKSGVGAAEFGVADERQARGRKLVAVVIQTQMAI